MAMATSLHPISVEGVLRPYADPVLTSDKRGPTIIGTKTYAKRFHAGEVQLGCPDFVAVEGRP